jgi:hypothetical protein
LERTQQKGLFPSNYVKLHTPVKILPSDKRNEESQTNNTFKEQQGIEKAQYKTSETVESKKHKKDERYDERGSSSMGITDYPCHLINKFVITPINFIVVIILLLVVRVLKITVISAERLRFI